MADPTPAPHSPDPRIAALEAELAALRKEAAERAALQTMVDQLRDANEHLVLASLHAQARQDEAEAANRRQNEFLAMLAHELRNPLAPISMAALLLEKMPDSSQQLRKVQAIVSRQVNQISRLLDDLLDAARISSGKIALVPHSVLLSEIIERTIETVQPRIEERSQQLTVELPLHEVVLEGDPVRLTQVLANLLVNASKFTPNGGQLSLRAALAEYGVEIAVQDNGIGLASDLMPHVFDLFTQGPRSLARPEGGLGIGLNVVRNLVQMHGGSVAVHSDGLGQGATFTVSLPVSDASAPPVRLVRETSIRIASRCRVLLVEDNTDACAMLAGVLEMEGYEVVCTANGSSGLALAMDSQFDVLLSDIGLPGLDGFTLVRLLRGELGDQMPLAIALSGYGQSEDQIRALEAGFDHYFVKPVDGHALLELLSARMARRPLLSVDERYDEMADAMDDDTRDTGGAGMLAS